MTTLQQRLTEIQKDVQLMNIKREDVLQIKQISLILQDVSWKKNLKVPAKMVSWIP